MTLTERACPACAQPLGSGQLTCAGCGHSLLTAVPQHDSDPGIRVGDVLNGKYRIEREIGRGGMGVVYLAEDVLLKRSIVIKTILTHDDPLLAAMAIQEREFLAAVKHPNVVAIYDFLAIGGTGYIVMEHVAGRTLSSVMEEAADGCLDVVQAVEYVLDILPAFAYLHRLDLVYCDFKPQNVMLETLRDGRTMVKLIDLGTVVKYNPAPSTVFGTPGFSAPEAFRTPSANTDLYSVCRTLAYLVTRMDLTRPAFGIPPHDQYAAFQTNPPFYRFLLRGTAPDPAARYQSADDMRDQLEGVLRLLVGPRQGRPRESTLFDPPSSWTTANGLPPTAAPAVAADDALAALVRQGDSLAAHGHETDALVAYSQAAALNPKNVDAPLRLARLYLTREQATRSLTWLLKAQRAEPDSWKVAWFTGLLLEMQGDLEEASSVYLELMHRLPGETQPLAAAARVFSRLGRRPLAIELYRTILTAEPLNSQARVLLALELQEQGDVASAIATLDGVPSDSGDYPRAQLLIAQMATPHQSLLVAAGHALLRLAGHTWRAEYHLRVAEYYRQLTRYWTKGSDWPLPAWHGPLPPSLRALRAIAEEQYDAYLRRESPPQREQLVRDKVEVSPWRLW